MKKTLDDLTPEIISKIQSYQDRCKEGIFDGQNYCNFDKEKARAAVNWNYTFCKKQEPLILVAENPLAAQLYYNTIINSQKLLRLVNILHSVKHNHNIDDDSKLTELRSELDSELYSKLCSELGSELRSELDSELYSKLGSELRSELDSELDSELYTELCSELRSELDSELDSELYTELRSELDSELYSKLCSELGSELRSELDSELYSKLGSELRSELDSELDSELYTELDSELDSELGSELHSELYSRKLTFINDYLFTLNIYSNLYYTWYEFIRNEFNLTLSINDKFQECFKLQKESNIYSAIFTDKLCIVSKYPKSIHRNGIRLHSIKSNAVEWGYSSELTKWNCHYINGRRISTDNFNKVHDNTLTFNEFMHITNEDEKASVVTMIKEIGGNERLLKFLDVELIDESTLHHFSGHSETQQLYRTKEKMTFIANDNDQQGEYMSFYSITCPSTGSNYIIDTMPTFTTVDECAKFHRPSFIPKELSYNFTQFNN